ncbi:hypothetical protein [Staphylococcus phage vB_SauM-T-SE-G1]|nr:hypothetical protein [Staphylococcus phage vB_SauM-V1SA15]
MTIKRYNIEGVYYCDRGREINSVDLSSIYDNGNLKWNELPGENIKIVYNNEIYNINVIKYYFNKTHYLELYNDCNKRTINICGKNLKEVRVKNLFEKRLSDDENMRELFPSNWEVVKDLTLQSNKVVTVTCPRCTSTKEMKLTDLYNYGLGCRMCSDRRSKGEKAVETILIDNNVDYITEKTFMNLKSNKGFNLRFDFYFIYNDIEYCIEVQGRQHIEDTYSGRFDHQSIIENDKIKKEFCKNNNIVLIEINYFSTNIKSLISDLKTKLPFLLVNERKIKKQLTFNITYNKVDTEDVKRRYLQGEGYKSIGSKYDLSATTIKNLVKSLGIYVEGGIRNKG